MIDVNNSKSLPANDVEALAEAKGLTQSQFRESVYIDAGYRSWEDHYRSLLVDPYEYYSSKFPGETVFRYVQTHPDLDHMSGLNRFFFQEEVRLLNFWDTANTKQLEEQDFGSTYDYMDWLAYQTLRENSGPEGSTHKVLLQLQGVSGSYWDEDGAKVWGPTAELLSACHARLTWNDSSLVLRLTYGGRHVILPGDAQEVEWDEICDSIGEANMRCDILKAAHHGRESGYSTRATNAMDPSFVICSVGKKPSTDASDEYARHGASVLSTRYHGTIRVQIWGDGEVWIYDQAGLRIGSLPPLT
jgi:hypothetical protein